VLVGGQPVQPQPVDGRRQPGATAAAAAASDHHRLGPLSHLLFPHALFPRFQLVAPQPVDEHHVHQGGPGTRVVEHLAPNPVAVGLVSRRSGPAVGRRALAENRGGPRETGALLDRQSDQPPTTTGRPQQKRSRQNDLVAERALGARPTRHQGPSVRCQVGLEITDDAQNVPGGLHGVPATGTQRAVVSGYTAAAAAAAE